MQQFNRDKLGLVSRNDAAVGCMAIISALQDFPPHVQVAAAAATFRMIADRIGMSVPDIMTVAGNVIHDAEGKRAEFAAVAEFMNKEW